MVNLEELVRAITAGSNGMPGISVNGESIAAERENLIPLLEVLKEDFKYILLLDVTAVDYPDRYEVLYHVMNEDADIVRVKVKLSKGDCTIPSATSVWKAADVLEREVYDLMGISFSGRSGLKRILCREDFEGHPLRKDFLLNPAERF